MPCFEQLALELCLKIYFRDRQHLVNFLCVATKDIKRWSFKISMSNARRMSNAWIWICQVKSLRFNWAFIFYCGEIQRDVPHI